jgi:hypothetical protein
MRRIATKIALLSAVLSVLAFAGPAIASACTVTHGSSFSASNPLINVTATTSQLPDSVLVAGIGWPYQSGSQTQLDSTHWLEKYTYAGGGYVAGHSYSVDIYWASGSCAGHWTSTINAI